MEPQRPPRRGWFAGAPFPPEQNGPRMPRDRRQASPPRDQRRNANGGAVPGGNHANEGNDNARDDSNGRDEVRPPYHRIWAGYLLSCARYLWAIIVRVFIYACRLVKWTVVILAFLVLFTCFFLHCSISLGRQVDIAANDLSAQRQVLSSKSIYTNLDRAQKGNSLLPQALSYLEALRESDPALIWAAHQDLRASISIVSSSSRAMSKIFSNRLKRMPGLDYIIAVQAVDSVLANAWKPPLPSKLGFSIVPDRQVQLEKLIAIVPSLHASIKEELDELRSLKSYMAQGEWSRQRDVMHEIADAVKREPYSDRKQFKWANLAHADLVRVVDLFEEDVLVLTASIGQLAFLESGLERWQTNASNRQHAWSESWLDWGWRWAWRFMTRRDDFTLVWFLSRWESGWASTQFRELEESLCWLGNNSTRDIGPMEYGKTRGDVGDFGWSCVYR